ncbi:MucBP domain-containing protein [Enterococcus sp. DIV0187]|uniref:MucBP domain-containing protein n=1 Tax=Enterococcus sp. DIV0187 TaxID=2774644 RepID=UPI003F24E735
MRRNKLRKLFVLSLAFFGTVAFADKASAAEMHRLYNPNSGEHFYTANTNEKNHLNKIGWKYEGIGWTAPSGGNAVYRMYNKNAGDHHYTMNANEKNHLVKVGWKYEGIGWYSDTKKSVPLYRAYNPNAKAGSHNYTVNYGEQQNLLKVGWRNEGIAWYGINNTNPTPPKPAPKPITKYTVTVKHVGSDRKTLKSASISIEKGKSYTAKAGSFSGYTLKGSNSQTVTVNGNKTITFNYTKNAPPVQKHLITTQHNDENGKNLKTTNEFVVENTQYTAKAISISGYTLIGQAAKTITVKGSVIITFSYKKNPEPKPKFTVTTKHITTDNTLLDSTTNQAEKGQNFTAKARTFTDYELIGNASQTINVQNNATITFTYEKIKRPDTFNLHVYVDDVFYKTIVKTINDGESYQPATKNLGLDENEFDLSDGVTYQQKNWIGGQTYNYDFYVSRYEVLSDTEKAKAVSTILTNVNALRAQYGRQPVQALTQLNSAAGLRAREIQELFSHYRPDGSECKTVLAEFGINNAGYFGENIATNSSVSFSDGQRVGQRLYDQWFDSAGHKANMLDANYKYIGIGLFTDKNTVYGTQLFMSYN